jgi:transcriptional regulator with XRE-family HTH domain
MEEIMFWKNFIDLCAKNDISPNAVAKILSISSGAVTRWKNGATPNDVTLRKIANHFNVSVDYLLNGNSESKVSPPEEFPRGLDEKTTEVVMKLNRLSDEQKAKVLSFLEYLAFQENQGTQ